MASLKTQTPNWVDTTPSECTYRLIMSDAAGQVVQSVDMTRPEFVTLKAQLAEIRGLSLADDEVLREAALGFLRECAERKDDIGLLCLELMRAQAVGDQKRCAKLSRPLGAFMQATAEGRVVKQTANDVHVQVEIAPELKAEIAAAASDIRRRRGRKGPARSATRLTSKRTA